MNKYLIRLYGGAALAPWNIHYLAVDISAALKYCEEQFCFFPNIDEMQVFDAEGDQRLVGVVRRKVYYDWVPA